MPGRPDFAFPARRLAVFVDGCFWHGCPRHGTLPKSNARFWREKIARNRERDREVNRELRRRGWRVLRIWEHELGRTGERRVGRKIGRVEKWKSGKLGDAEVRKVGSTAGRRPGR